MTIKYTPNVQKVHDMMNDYASSGTVYGFLLQHPDTIAELHPKEVEFFQGDFRKNLSDSESNIFNELVDEVKSQGLEADVMVA